MNPKIVSLPILIVIATSFSSAIAESAIFNKASGDWNVDANWATTDAVPTSADTAFIRWASDSMRTANVTSSVPDVASMSIGALDARGTVNIQSGGSLTILGTTTVAASRSTVSTNLLDHAFLNVAGGSFTSQGALTLGGNSLGGNLVVSGGSATLNGVIVGSGTGGFGNLEVSSGSVTTTTMVIAGGVGSTGSIAISGGGLTVSNSAVDVYLGQRVNNSTTTGSLTLSAGTLHLGDATANGRLMVGVSGADTQTINSFVLISGGNFEGKMMVGNNSVLMAGSNGVVTIRGSEATIGSTITTGNGFELRSSGRIIFELDSTGISTLDYSTSNVSFSVGADLWVDGSSYTGGSQIFTLISAASFTNGNFNTIDESVFGFAPEYTTNLLFDGTNLNLSITVIPEPSLFELLVLGVGICIVMGVVRARRCRTLNSVDIG